MDQLKGMKKIYDMSASSRCFGFLKIRTTKIDTSGIYVLIGSNDKLAYNPVFSELYNLIGKLMVKIICHKKNLQVNSPVNPHKPSSPFYSIVDKVQYMIVEHLEFLFGQKLEMYLEKKFPGWIENKVLNIRFTDHDIHDIIITSNKIQTYLFTFNVDFIFKEIKKFASTMKKARILSKMHTAKNTKIVLCSDGMVLDVETTNRDNLEYLLDLDNIEYDNFGKQNINLMTLLSKSLPYHHTLIESIKNRKAYDAPNSLIEKVVLDELTLLTIDVAPQAKAPGAQSVKDKVLSNAPSQLSKLKLTVKNKLIKVGAIARDLVTHNIEFVGYEPGFSNINDKKRTLMKNSVLEQWIPQNNELNSTQALKDQIEISDQVAIEEQLNEELIRKTKNIRNTEFYEQAFKKSLSDWNLPIIQMHKPELFGFVWKIFQSEGFPQLYEFNMPAWWSFMEELHEWYTFKKNPFHNFNHGVNVLHASYYYAKYAGLSNHISEMNLFSYLLASLCHDVGHRGKNNNFEINSLSELAKVYHDISVLEQHHCALTVKLLTQSNNNFLVKLKVEDFRKIRKNLIKCILATDMKEHFGLIDKFKNGMESCKQPKDKLDDDKQMFVCSFFVHVADLSGPSKEYSIAAEWSRLVNIEFTTQYNKEIEYGMAVTPYFKDLDKLDVYYENEIKFQSVFIAPLLEVANLYVDGQLKFAIDIVNANSEMYTTKLSELKEKELKAAESNASLATATNLSPLKN